MNDGWNDSLRGTKLSIYGIYCFGLNLLYGLMEVFPPVVRNLIFKMIFKKMGKKCLVDYKTYFRYPSKISIGDSVGINRGCELYASYWDRDAEIRIGNNVALGPNVRIFMATHDVSSLGLSDTAGSVIIEDHVWIGGGAIILPNVTLGEGAVIGAGSVVTQNIPRYSIAVGNPARVIKKREIVRKSNG